MNVVPSNDVEGFLDVARKSMEPYFLENDLVWDHKKRTEICRSGTLYEVRDPEVVGYFLVRESKGKFHLADIQIAAEYQNRGYGSAILNTVKGMARSMGYDTVWLKAFRTNPAIRLYRRCGFSLVSQERYVDVYTAPAEGPHGRRHLFR